MRYSLLVLSAACMIMACKKKPSLTPDDTQYVRTTIGLMRVRSELQPTTDSVEVSRRLDSVFRAFSTSKAQYQAAASQLGLDEEHATIVYAAIKDSLKLK